MNRHDYKLQSTTLRTRIANSNTLWSDFPSGRTFKRPVNFLHVFLQLLQALFENLSRFSKNIFELFNNKCQLGDGREHEVAWSWRRVEERDNSC